LNHICTKCPTCGQICHGDIILIDSGTGEIARHGRSAKLRAGHQVRILTALYRAYPADVATSVLVDRVYGHREDGGADYAQEIIRSRICIMRDRLEPLGLRIVVAWGFGYRLVIDPITEMEKAA
jgi:DNA-binding response OmpR family regulator